MDIRFLTTFTEVVNTRHFGKAAENLYLTQSAVSARIKLLEEYFHTTLFIRQRNSIQLTQAGEKLLPYAKQLCETLNEAKQELQVQSAEYVVCGATQLASELTLPGALSHLHSAFPDWSVKAEVLTLDNLSRQLHERVIDVAFSTEMLKSEEVVSHVMERKPLSLCQFPGNGTGDANGFVTIDWGAKVRDKVLTQFPHFRDAKLRTNSLSLALTTLQSEGGIAVLPRETASRFVESSSATFFETLNDCSVNVYMHTMKSVRRVGLSEVIDSLAPA